VNYFKTVDNEWYNQRLTGAMFCIMLAFMTLIARLFYLQVVEGDEYRRLSENNCIRLQTIGAPRGVIFDRNGELLVDNRPSFTLKIIPGDARPVKETVRKLSEYTGIPVAEMMDKLERNRQAPYKPVLLKQDINRGILGIVEAHHFDLPGVMVETELKRYYVHNTAAHLVGYLGEINQEELQRETDADVYRKDRLKYRRGDAIGKFGVEKSFEGDLRGRSGGRQVEVNARGQVVRVMGMDESEPGENLLLSIDLKLQQKGEALMADKVGGLIAMDASNGEVLAMISSPTFDPKAFVDGMSHDTWNSLISNPFRPIQNKVIQGKYPPASTYKIITAIAGLEEGVISEHTKVFCPGYYRYGDRIFRCWKSSGHGNEDVVGALAGSCDVFFYQVGQKLGVDRLAYYAKACGLGSLTGIELDHEVAGLIPTAAWKKRRKGVPWQRGETLSVAIGQGYNLATPLQMAGLTAAVANGGTLYKPSIVSRIVKSDGTVSYIHQPVIMGKLPVSRKNLEIVKKGLWGVVNSPRGTARVARVNGVTVYGKTGTAQVVSRRKNEAAYQRKARLFKPHAWFVGFGEREGRQIAVAVIVEHGEHGAGTAAPIVRDLIKAYFFKDDEQVTAEK